MALFGRNMMVDRSGFDLAPPSPVMGRTTVPDQRSMATPVVQAGLQKMSLGDKVGSALGMDGGLSGQNVLDFLLGGYEGLDRRRAMGMQDKALQEREDLKRQQASIYDQLASGGIDQANPFPTLARAQQAGMDIGDLVDLVQSRQPKTINTQYGAYTVYPDGRAEPIGQDPLADQRKRLLEAQIAAVKAQEFQRQNMGDYYDARARQPYAPPRKSSGGGRSGGGKGTNQEPPE